MPRGPAGAASIQRGGGDPADPGMGDLCQCHRLRPWSEIHLGRRPGQRALWRPRDMTVGRLKFLSAIRVDCFCNAKDARAGAEMGGGWSGVDKTDHPV